MSVVGAPYQQGVSAPGKAWLERKEADATLKLEREAQRVKVPRSERLASELPASLAWCRGDPGCEA
jgi:hypothetical protein